MVTWLHATGIGPASVMICSALSQCIGTVNEPLYCPVDLVHVRRSLDKTVGVLLLLLLLCAAGRVYKGRWRGMDVAVKVLHHDINTAAAVANEVDLVMSFR